jgi:3-hydroxyisobutyrate dehydrogenase
MERVGFVGLGAMGEPMAANLQRAGMLDVVWNRSPGRSAAFAASHAVTVAEDLASLAGRCDVVVLCVSADTDLLQCVDVLSENCAAGALVLDCSTVAAATAREAAARLATATIGFCDCPVSGGTEGARAGSLSIMVGGSEADFARARPILDVMGAHVSHIGTVGSGQATKATNQIMVAGVNQAVSEAMAFARAEGLPLDKVAEALSHGAAASWFLKFRAPNMIRGEYPLGFKVALHEKDLEICRVMAEAHGVKLPLVEMTLVHYSRLPRNDREEQDISSLFRIKDAMFADRDPND